MNVEQVEVTSADIDAAQAIYDTIPLYAMGQVKARAGHDLVIAFAKHRLAALAKADRILSLDQWRGMEGAPRDGTRVLLWTDTRGLADQRYIEQICEGEHFAEAQIGSWEGVAWDIPRIGEPTHWMPLPPAPGEKG